MRGVGSPTGSVDIVGRAPVGEDGESDAEVDPLPEYSTPFMLHAPADASRPTFSGSSRASRALERRRSRRIARSVWTDAVWTSELDGFSAAVWSAGDARALAGRGAGGRTNAGFGSTKESTRRTRCARGVLDARPALNLRRSLTRSAGTFFPRGGNGRNMQKRDWSRSFVTGPPENVTPFGANPQFGQKYKSNS